MYIKRQKLTGAYGNGIHAMVNGGGNVGSKQQKLKAPFPAFGGKARVADLVWDRLGDVQNFIEPFANSAAVLLARPHAPRIETLNDMDCVAPETRMLRGDLSWAAAGDVKVGDVLMGFDEENGPARDGFRAPTRYRRWCQTEVLAVRRLVKPCYRLTFDDGTVVTASEDHLWLGGSHCSGGGGKGGRGWRWQQTKGLVCNRKTQRSWLLKATPVVSREESHDAGWLAGLYDGEGHLTVAPGWRLILSQKPGKVLDRAESLLRERGYKTQVVVAKSGVARLSIDGGKSETLRLLMQIRPGRLIENLSSQLPQLSLYGRDHRAVGLVSKEFLGDREVVAIQTSSRTFIAEGLASHNCYIANFWRSTSTCPELVAEWADDPVSECDMHARHRWLVLSHSAAEFRRRMKTEPGYFDARVAGWWCWGLCCWIGSGWCQAPAERDRGDRVWTNTENVPWSVKGVTGQDNRKPRIDGGEGQYGHGVHAQGQLPMLTGDSGASGRGVHAKRPKISGANGQGGGNGGETGVNAQVLTQQMPMLTGHTGTDGRAIHDSRKAETYADGNRPQLADAYARGRGVNGNDAAGTCEQRRAWLVDWFRRLRDRLRTVRVCCGDWLRVCDSESVTTRLGVTGLFLDPPYGHGSGRQEAIYSTDSMTVAADVRRYCLERGADPKMRLCLAGYAGEGHEVLEKAGWDVVVWNSPGGYGNRSAKGKANSKKERLWFSPACQQPAQYELFGRPELVT